MDGGAGRGAMSQQQQPLQPGQDQSQQQQQKVVVERLSQGVQQQLNLESVKTRAIGLFKAISRILEDFDVIARTNSVPKWQDILGQFSMVNLELYNIVEDIKKVSKAFVVYPKNVNAENATILPVMLSSKLLPEMEVEDNTKREQLLIGMQNLPIPKQIEKIKARIDMIGAACESAEKILAETRKAYGLVGRQVASVLPTIDKVQAAKIQEQENLLRAAVNSGSRMQVDQRQLPASLPMHLVDVLTVGDGPQNFPDASGMYSKNTPTSNNVNSQGALLQATVAQLIGRSIPSPGMTGAASFDNTTTSPLPYANSPRSGTNIMNAPSPQQQTQQQQHQQQLQQQLQLQQQQLQRQKLMQQLPPHQQQLFAQQSLRQNSGQGVGQTQLSQLHDMSGASQKFQTMQYSQPLGNQQFQGRQLQSGQMQHAIGQNQLNQGNLRNHLSQLAGTANNALFSAAQSSPNSHMIPDISSTIASQSLLPRAQYGLSTAHQQRNSSSLLNDQMSNMGANPDNMMTMQQKQQQQQQQLGAQGGFGNMSANAQNLQSGMMSQNPNFQQQNQQ